MKKTIDNIVLDSDDDIDIKYRKDNNDIVI
jgi:hypothetical protein